MLPPPPVVRVWQPNLTAPYCHFVCQETGHVVRIGTTGTPTLLGFLSSFGDDLGLPSGHAPTLVLLVGRFSRPCARQRERERDDRLPTCGVSSRDEDVLCEHLVERP